MTSQEN